MTKKEICENHKTVAYYSGLNGVEIKDIEYGIDDHIYCVSGALGGGKRYHRAKVEYNTNGDGFFRLFGRRISLGECIRV